MAFGTQDDTDDVMNEINMTPLVDVMLVLLIIFIITVPVMKHAVNIDLPRASSQPQDTKPLTVRLAVDAQGAYFWNDSRIDDKALPSMLKARIPLIRRRSGRMECRRESPPSTVFRAVKSTRAPSGPTGSTSLRSTIQPSRPA